MEPKEGQGRTSIMNYAKGASSALLLAAILAAGCATAPAGAGRHLEPGLKPQALGRLSFGLDFTAPPGSWTGEGVAIEAGRLVLAPGRSSGDFLSPIYAMPAFDWLVPSWSIAVPGASSVQVGVQVRVKGSWSEWYSFGTWQAHPASAAKSADGLGRVEVDTLLLYEGADALRFRLALAAGADASLPSVASLSWVARDRFAAAPAESATPDWKELSFPVPARSQMVEDPGIASRICSPTSLSMVLASLGKDLPVAGVAAMVYDEGAGIYGNWAFNASLAASLGFKARVDYLATMDELARLLEAGHPVVASVRYGRGELSNAAIAATDGHLLVVRGLAKHGEDWYVLVNDPAASGPAEVPREYLARQFKNVWTGVVYIVTD